MPTDTIYGIVGSAFSPAAVERIYKLRKRNASKPFIVLISSVTDLDKFGVEFGSGDRKFLKKIWPGPISVILDVPSKSFLYLKRKEAGLAFRLPEPKWLRDFLAKSGPLVAPSANIEGDPPSRNLSDAKKYFDDKVDFYLFSGDLVSKPSTLISLKGGKVKVLREGAYDVGKLKTLS